MALISSKGPGQGCKGASGASSASPASGFEFENNLRDGQDLLARMGFPFFQAVMDNVPDLIWVKDMGDSYLFANKAACDILLKCPCPVDAVGKNDLFFAESERKAGFIHTFGEICIDSDQVVKETRKPGRFIEEGLVRGENLVLDVHKAPLLDNEGQMVGTVGFARNITREKAIEQALVRSQERFHQLAELLPIPVAEFDFNLNIIYANRVGLDFFGYSRKDYLGPSSIGRLVPREKRKSVRSIIEKLRHGHLLETFEMQFIKKDGTRTYGVITAAPILEKGRVVAVRACFTDLTERRASEMAVQESQMRFRTLFNGFNDAVFVHPFSDQGFKKFVEVNELACQWYGYTRNELLQMSPMDLLVQSEGEKMAHRTSRMELKRQGRRTLETVSRTKANETFPVEIISSIFTYQGKELVLSTVRDITERRQRENERADAVKFAGEQEKYALVGQVAGKMAHDFNNVLGGIMGNAELSLMGCENPEIRQSLEVILDQTLKGRNLTRNLVAFARDQEPHETLFDINQKMDLVFSLLKKDLEGVRVFRQYGDSLPELLADPGMIEHALVNLIQNAIHATSLVPEPVLAVTTRFKDDSLKIEIQDNGCGIPGAFQDKIYDPAFTLKGSKDTLGAYRNGIKGTGYGMANVKKYIEKHRGRITFTSEPGHGTTFFLSIPLTRKALTAREKERMTQHELVTGRRILLVEDEAAISSIQKRVLSQEPFGHKVVTAASAQAAIDAFDMGAFDLVCLDYILEGKRSGMDVYTHIRASNPRVPVVFLSGNIEFIESMKALQKEDAALGHLAKPCENVVFAQTINSWLWKAHRSREADRSG